MVSEDLWEEWLQCVLVLCQHNFVIFSAVKTCRTKRCAQTRWTSFFSTRMIISAPVLQDTFCLHWLLNCSMGRSSHLITAQHFPESQLFLRNKPIPYTLQMRKYNHFSFLVVNQDYSWSPWSLLSFSAYQSETEMHILQFCQSRSKAH